MSRKIVTLIPVEIVVDENDKVTYVPNIENQDAQNALGLSGGFPTILTAVRHLKRAKKSHQVLALVSSWLKDYDSDV